MALINRPASSDNRSNQSAISDTYSDQPASSDTHSNQSAKRPTTAGPPIRRERAGELTTGGRAHTANHVAEVHIHLLQWTNLVSLWRNEEDDRVAVPGTLAPVANKKKQVGEKQKGRTYFRTRLVSPKASRTDINRTSTRISHEKSNQHHDSHITGGSATTMADVPILHARIAVICCYA